MSYRYQVAPHYDCWMQGDRIGIEVKRTKKDGREVIHLRMETSGKTRKFWADEVTPL